MAMLFGAAAFSQLKLQTVDRSNTIAKAEDVNKYFTTRTDAAARGEIYTSDYKPLAEDASTYKLSLLFSKVPRSPAFAFALSQATGIPAMEFSDRTTGSREWPILFNIDQVAAIRLVKKRWDADGISIVGTGARRYPFGEYTNPVVGYQRPSSDDPKKLERAGLEATLNGLLSGVDGKRTGLMDTKGQFLPMRSFLPEVEKKDGALIVTTLDSSIQVTAAKAIKRAVEQNRADSGIAVVTNPNTGEIYGLASYPTSDPNDQKRNVVDSQNFAASQILEPGSTFKIFTLARALDLGVVNTGTYGYCNGTHQINSESAIHCASHDGVSGSHGSIDPEMAIAKSCNVMAAIWARKIGYDRFFELLRDLGFGEKSGVSLYGETKSRFVKRAYAKQLQLTNMGFGQALNVTPISLAAAFGAISNKGVMVPLRIVKSIDGRDQPIPPGKKVFSKNSADFLLKAMADVMHTGTGKSIAVPGYTIGGKTGTAQKIGKLGDVGYVSSFIGVMPAKNPVVQVLVMVNNPRAEKHYGADVAGPVFKEIAKASGEKLAIPHDNIKPPVAVTSGP
jgi:cell division protein FtsI/penicillin-binding protein 2